MRAIFSIVVSHDLVEPAIDGCAVTGDFEADV